MLSDIQSAQSIYVHSDSVDTVVEYNQFIDEKTISDNDKSSLLTNLGRSSIIRYNNFDYFVNQNLGAFIQVGDLENEQLDTDIGRDTRIYQNSFSVDDQMPVTVASSEYLLVQVAENQGLNDYQLNFSGGTYQQISLPEFQIRAAEEQTSCFDLQESEEQDRTNVILNHCDGSLSQQWQIEVDVAPYVLISNITRPGEYIRTSTGFVNGCSEGNELFSNLYLEEDVYGYAQRWLIDHTGEEVLIRSKKELSFVLTVAGDALASGSNIVTCPLSLSKQQRFVLDY